MYKMDKNLEMIRIQLNQFRDEHEQIKEIVRKMDETICQKANKMSIHELAQAMEEKCVFKQQFEREKGLFRAAAQRID
jgi:transcriptional regulator CtsR